MFSREARLLVFCCLAAALGLAAPAAEALTLQAERGRGFKVVRDRSASGGRAIVMTGRGALRRRVSTAALARIAVRARGGACAGRRPRMAVSLDGRRVATFVIRSRRWRGHARGVRVAAGRHIVAVGLLNPRRTRRCTRRLLVDSLTLTPAPAAPAPAPPPQAQPAQSPDPGPQYTNPVHPTSFPDPMVLDAGGGHSDYYAFSTGDRFPVLRSSDLVHWTEAGTAMTTRPAWTNQVNANWNPWAPSVVETDAGFVMFYVAINTALNPDTNCIGVATSASPGGPYADQGMLTGPGGPDQSGRPLGCGDDAGYSNIDPQPFVEENGSAYLLLSTGHRCPAPTPNGACDWDRQLSLIPLADNLLSATGPRQAILPGGDGWEAAFGDHVVEAPWLRRRGSTYELFYSGGSFQGAYGMGYATASEIGGPYTKSAFNPILTGTPEVVGPGGGSLVTGPRGGQWVAYHGRAEAFPSPRLLRMDPVGDSGGRIAIDGPTTAPRPVP